MTEATGERIRPPKAAYKETPYESPARLGNGAALPLSDSPTAAVNPAKLSLRAIEEVGPDASTALIDASRKVYTAVTQRIATLERELRQLREVAALFAAVSIPRQSDAAAPMTAEARIKELLDLADQLQPNGEQTP